MQGEWGTRRIRRTSLVDLPLRTLLVRVGELGRSLFISRVGGRVSIIGPEEEEHVVEAEIPPTFDSLPAEERI